MKQVIDNQMFVTKRNGEVVNFDPEKIKVAIGKCIRAAKKEINQEGLNQIVNSIVEEIQTRFIDFYPNVENVQDIVEKHLIDNDLYEIAKGYILYRAKRREDREKQQEITIEKAKLGKLRVKKRDGRTILFDINKINQIIKDAVKGFEEDVSVEEISKEVIKNIYDGVSVDEIEKALILASISFIEKDPSYNFVSSKLFLYKLYREVVGEPYNNSNMENLYRSSFTYSIQKGIEEGILDKRLLEFDLEKLSKELIIERDNLIQYMGLEILYDRYFGRIGNRRIEMPQTFWMRVAMGLAVLDGEQKNDRAIEYYNLLSSLKFVSSSPTLFNSGTTHPQLSSCYLTTVMDDLHHIFKSYGDNAQLSKWSGGVANDWSNIRAVGTMINSNKIESQGVVPFLKIANDAALAINRSGRKRGAVVAYLETWHFEIEDFLDLRRNTGDERRRTHDMNTAHWIPDLFVKRVIKDEDWTLFSPSDVPDLHDLYGKKFEKRYEEYEEMAKRGEILSKVVSSVKLWRKMLSMLFETGHPWMTFKDPCNIRSPQDHVGVVHSSNLCTEITLNTSEDEIAVCNLGSINLGRHIVDGKLDAELVEKTVRTAIRMLDNVIDINFYPTKEAKNSNLKHRPIGFGLMGFQDALYKLDINFDSKEAIEFADRSMEIISYYSILTSSELAREKGVYSTYKGSKWDRGIFPIDTIDLLEEERGMKIDVSRDEKLDWTPVRKHVKEFGMRNSNVMAIAPTATIGNISGAYPCIEPIYKNIYVKANVTGEFTIVNHYLVNDLKKLNLWNDEMLEQLKFNDGNLNKIGSIPDKLKDKYKEAFDIEATTLIDLAAVRGKWIDQSQSLNIFIKGVSGRKLDDAYMHAWTKGLKTTYYMRGMAATQIEKSTLDAQKYGFTQKRDNENIKTEDIVVQDDSIKISPIAVKPAITVPEVKEKPKLCLIEDPDCEACQ
ncbi:ribonucleoside-diphosphate reductase subunit alpha [Candidatus Pacearchaeota archaeon]|jgi:ribonucleoside-diphosphate reductase alpha chain|nr:ribonucleoside-diphosphate reductase subunit alpha [Candidatus Pacearchaeota archaeon]|tara:strand:+ start:3356 stop:6199 length:2844 start_codon:yes stop_codon:yes gene_type:complete